MVKANQDIRQAVKEAGLKLWQVATQLKINDGNFSRLLRNELLKEQKDAIFLIIKGLKEGDK